MESERAAGVSAGCCSSSDPGVCGLLTETLALLAEASWDASASYDRGRALRFERHRLTTLFQRRQAHRI
jgi:hypothetical protein